MITILAIDRAEAALEEAVAKFEEMLHQKVECILLVNKTFRYSPAYYGNECSRIFKEVVVDFDDKDKLERIIAVECHGEKIVTHCRMEEAIKDFEKVIPFLPNSFTQTIEALELTTQKSLMRRAMIDTYPEIAPKFINIDSVENFNESLLEGMNYPLILKPNGLHSSFLVTKCDNYETLKQSLEYSFPVAQSVYEREYGTGSPSFIIEEYIEGSMYSSDVYIDNSGLIYYLPLVAVTTSSEVGLDGYYGYEFKLPANLDDSSVKEAYACIEKCVKSVRLKNSVAHIELFKTKNGWKIIEIGPRIGGYRHTMYKQAYGVDHFLNDLLIHAGEIPIIQPKFQRYSGCVNIYTEKEGTIKEVLGSQEAATLESVVQMGVYVKSGDKAIFASNGGKMVADATFGSDDLEKLDADIEQFRKTLKFIVE